MSRFELEIYWKMLINVVGQLAGSQLPRRRAASPGGPRAWWQKPGLSVMYQIESRPGYEWNRDYTAFNKTLTDPATGKFKFDGPLCQIENWVRLSQAIGLDYHVLEIKWHDGICYFSTKNTEWKTPTDYAAQFAEASRRAGLPFMFYYSSIFDHNPQLDSLQPDPHNTMSFLGEKPGSPYLAYMCQHYDEILAQYQPDGMWLDIFFPEQSSRESVDYFRKKSPGTVVTFNGSNLFHSDAAGLTYTTGEAHALDGNLFKPVQGILLQESCWKWANTYRKVFTTPWELASPAGRSWQEPDLRDDIHDLVRMSAITLACGGKHCIGATSLMNGDIHPAHLRQLETLGAWYKPRKGFFTEAAPLPDWGAPRWRVSTGSSALRALGTRRGAGVLLHVINMGADPAPLTVELGGSAWQSATEACLEPSHTRVEIQGAGGRRHIRLEKDQVDPVDTLLSILVP
jgi:hypothetical protein